jgi:hypothetical protein
MKFCFNAALEIQESIMNTYNMSFWHYDTQHNDTQHNDTQHKGIICDIQHNDTQYNNDLPLC